MTQPLLDAYRFDPADPRSPSQEQWDRMPADERARVIAMLPDSRPEVVTDEEKAQRLAVASVFADVTAALADAAAAHADVAERRLAEALSEIARLESLR